MNSLKIHPTNTYTQHNKENQPMKQATKQGIKFGGAVFAGLMAALVATSGKAEAGDCKVTIVATINGGPAMRPVQIGVYQGDTLITSTTRHSFTTSLTCGQTYRAELQLDGTERDRTFKTATSDSTVVVAMD